MDQTALQDAQALLSFIAHSPTAYQAVDTMAALLDQAGFVRLQEHERWTLRPGQSCYLIRNGSALVAFRIPAAGADRFMAAAVHTDSPAFKLKADGELDAFGKYVRLNTERYGGMILSTWLDRPLSVAGRVIVQDGARFVPRSVTVDRDLVLIPNTCIHFNRELNDGYRYNPASDLLPLYAMTGGQPLRSVLAEAAGCAPEQLAGGDLFLYHRTPGTVWGAEREFFSAPRIDNLMCAYGALRGLLEAGPDGTAVQVLAALDNEETGSQSRQGAGCLLVRDVLERIAGALGHDLMQMLAGSMLLSADNAHARHPNRPELSDSGTNAPHMNAGVVIKHNAAQHYTTDAVSAALFSELCRSAGVPVQHFSNRSDLAGGSTLGGILNRSVPLCSVDVGMAQLAMHSSYETAGCADVTYIVRACRAFFRSALTCRDGGFELHTGR